MNHIYVVQYEGSDGAYVPLDTSDRTLEEALEEVKRLCWTRAKCYGIVNEGKLVHESSPYYAKFHLPVRQP